MPSCRDVVARLRAVGANSCPFSKLSPGLLGPTGIVSVEGTSSYDTHSSAVGSVSQAVAFPQTPTRNIPALWR